MPDPPQISPDTTIVRTQKVVTADMGKEIVMMSLEKSSYYGLDPIGSKIWERIEAPIRVAELCQGLAGEYDVDKEQCETDVLAFMNELYEHDIIHIVAPTAS